MLKRKNKIGYLIILIIIIFLSFNKTKYLKNNTNIFIFDNYNTTFDIYLKIPKINFEKKFNDKSTLKDNIMLSPYSKVKSNKSTIIILGHSGYAKNAFFNDLINLSINDEIIIKYFGVTYKYIIFDIDYITKKSSYLITYEQNNLYLVTCDINNLNKQIVIKARLKNV
ncbi:MAG: sortase [Bacilli bacterium]